MKVVLEGATEGADGERFRKVFTIESFTNAHGRWVLVDEDGEGRLMLTTDELAEIGGVSP